MRSICSIFAARGFCSVVIVSALIASTLQAENYSLWPRRPEAFAKVRKLMAEGDTEGSVRELTPLIREKGIVGREARAMLGEIRIREVLSPELCRPEVYTVRRGDAWLRIANRTKCPLDYLMHVNQLLELRSLQPGEKIRYKSLDYRVEVNIPEREVSLWEGDSFIKSYPIVMLKDEGKSNFSMTVGKKTATFAGAPVTVYSSHYASADKSIQLSHGGLVIDSSSDGKMRKQGFYLRREDCNELALLLRDGNKVDIIRESGK